MRFTITPECLRDLANYAEDGNALCNRFTFHTEEPAGVYTLEFTRDVAAQTLQVEVLDPAVTQLECACRPTA